MKSRVLTVCYKKWLASASKEAIDFVDSVYAMCEKHYGAGGDVIVECFEPAEILEKFKSLKEVREYCGMRVDKALDARWGEDTDPELNTARRFDEWEKEGLS